MAKITSKASLTLGTNLLLHIADKGGSDIALNDVNGTTGTITSSTTNFTAQTSAGGIVNRPIVVGDKLTISHTGNAANEGLQVEVDSVTANSIGVTYLNGAFTNESAGSDINLVGFKKTYEFVEAGGLSFIDGVQGIVLASEMVDLWDASDLDRYDRPFTSIEPRAKSLASLNGWEPHNADTLNAIRDTALEIRADATAAATRIYALWRSGNLHDVTDQFTFWSGNDAELDAPQQAVMTGYINQLFLLYDADNAIDNRGTWYTRCAEAGKTIVMEQHTVNYAEIMPVSSANAIDPKLGDGTPFVADGVISAGGIYANIEFYSDVDGVYVGDVDGANYNFNGYVDGDGQTNEAVHAKINWLLRQPTNINVDGTGATFRGDKQWPMSSFSGDVFTVDSYLLNYNAAQRNNLRVVDNTEIVRQWPSVMSLTINAPTLAVGGSFTIYHANTFGTAAAVVFEDENNIPQQDIAITASKGIIMAYSTYNVNGHTPNTPLPVKIAYNRPGFIEPDVIDVTLDGNNVAVTISPKADPSYIA